MPGSTRASASGGATPGTAWVLARVSARAAVGPLPVRVLPLAAAGRAVLAEDAVAATDLPAVDVSAMDGWAVAGPPPWRLTGLVLAGAAPDALAAGTAVAIATGAELPAGAGGVLRREFGVADATTLRPVSPVPSAASLSSGAEALDLAEMLRRDVRRAGEECRAGEVVLPAGSALTPAAVGLLAASGFDEVAVRRAGVDLLVIGDELLDSGPARHGRARDALGPLLSAWLPELGVTVAGRWRVPDRRGALVAALRSSLADVVITTGSTARGPVDHLHDVLADLGARLVVDGVAVRPGHPMLLAVLPDGRPLVGLPGNPLAAVSGVLTLVDPLVAGLHGLAERAPRTLRLVADVPAGADATRLVPVRDGRPAMFAGPAMLRGLAGADAVAVIPPGGAAAGQLVERLGIPFTP